MKKVKHKAIQNIDRRIKKFWQDTKFEKQAVQFGSKSNRNTKLTKLVPLQNTPLQTQRNINYPDLNQRTFKLSATQSNKTIFRKEDPKQIAERAKITPQKPQHTREFVSADATNEIEVKRHRVLSKIILGRWIQLLAPMLQVQIQDTDGWKNLMICKKNLKSAVRQIENKYIERRNQRKVMRAMRGYLARKLLKNLQDDVKQQKRIVKLQAVLRSKKSRLYSSTVLSAIAIIQAAFKSISASDTLKYQMRSIRFIQSFYRRRHMRKINSSTRLVSFVRAWLVRRRTRPLIQKRVSDKRKATFIAEKAAKLEQIKVRRNAVSVIEEWWLSVKWKRELVGIRAYLWTLPWECRLLYIKFKQVKSDADELKVDVARLIDKQKNQTDIVKRVKNSPILMDKRSTLITTVQSPRSNGSPLMRGQLQNRIREQKRARSRHLAENMLRGTMAVERRWLAQQGKVEGNEFTNKQRNKLRKIFNQLDRTGKGIVAVIDCVEPFISFGIIESFKELKKQIFKHWQKADDHIEFHDFLKIVTCNNAWMQFFKRLINGNNSTFFGLETLYLSRRRQYFLDAHTIKRRGWDAFEAVHKCSRGRNVMTAYQKEVERRTKFDPAYAYQRFTTSTTPNSPFQSPRGASNSFASPKGASNSPLKGSSCSDFNNYQEMRSSQNRINLRPKSALHIKLPSPRDLNSQGTPTRNKTVNKVSSRTRSPKILLRPSTQSNFRQTGIQSTVLELPKQSVGALMVDQPPPKGHRNSRMKQSVRKSTIKIVQNLKQPRSSQTLRQPKSKKILPIQQTLDTFRTSLNISTYKIQFQTSSPDIRPSSQYRRKKKLLKDTKNDISESHGLFMRAEKGIGRILTSKVSRFLNISYPNV